MQYFKNLRMPALLIGSLMFAAVATAGNTVKSAPNGIQLPDNYKDWRVISVSHRTDNKSLRVIIGNDIAIKAARDGNINPWPKGTILGKLAWKEIKDEVYGKKGTSRRDELEREFESFKIGLLLKKAREEKHLTQEQLADLVDKKRTYISRVENDGSNMTLKTLFDIVEKGLGGKVNISIQI